MASRTAARGYGWPHQKARKALSFAVARGEFNCWRCHEWIAPGDPWDLGHDDFDRSIYRGPECRKCNRATAGRKKNKSRQIRDW